MAEDPEVVEEIEAAEPAEPAEEVETRYGCPVTEFRGQAVLHVDRGRWRELAMELLADGWNMLIDVTSVDYLAHKGHRQLPDSVVPERFEVVASFISHNRGERIRLRAQVPDDDPRIDSLYAVYPGSDYLEREVFDLMGITFDGHPDLSRILMPENWDGHPLRKDYSVNAIPVQFKVHQS